MIEMRGADAALDSGFEDYEAPSLLPAPPSRERLLELLVVAAQRLDALESRQAAREARLDSAA